MFFCNRCNRPKKIAVFLVSLLFMNSFSPLLAGQLILKNNTLIQLELNETVSSHTHTAGQRIKCFVKHEVKIGNQAVIEAGSVVEGRVISATPNGLIGKAGKITIQLISLQAVDGTRIPLSASQTIEGEDRLVEAIVLLLFFLVGIFIKGENASLQAGSIMEARVIGDNAVTVN